jgi:nitroreductase/ferredoxin
MSWEDVKEVFRPESVRMGVMKADPKKCTRPRGSSCQLCWENCPFRAWGLVEGQEPRLVDNHVCFSCYNCQVACPRDAISMVEPYHVEKGFWTTGVLTEAVRSPSKPLDAEGNPDAWNVVEKTVFNRRSTRNFKNKPVPEPFIRRILEAGRFAPSAGNSQPWRFVVITDEDLLAEINEGIWGALSILFNMYHDEEMVKQLAAGFEMSQPRVAGAFDPRVVEGGMGAVARRDYPVLLGAPCVIYLLEDERAPTAGGMNIGIAGQNMNLVANSLGLGVCWNGFASIAGVIPPLAEKLGIVPPWKAMSALCIGYPKFKQEGVVAREYRPVTWFRKGQATEAD